MKHNLFEGWSSVLSGVLESPPPGKSVRRSLLCLLLTAAACGGSEEIDAPQPDVPEPVGPSEIHLTLTPERLEFDAGDPSSNVIRVATDASWRAESPSSDLRFEPASGRGDAAILIRDIPAGESRTLRVVAGEGAGAVTREAVVLRAAEVTPPPVETVFSLDFGPSMGSDSKFADSFDTWKTQTGTGAAGVVYGSYGVKIRSGYDGASAGASGAGYATMTATSSTNHFTVRNIALPAGATDFTLSFYANCCAEDLTITLSSGSASRTLHVSAGSSYNTWIRIAAGFTLTAPVSTLGISLAPSRSFAYEERRYGLNIDDLTLVTGGGGTAIDLGGTPSPGKEYRLPELPGNWVAPTSDRAVVSGDYAFYTHWTTTVSSGRRVRNYSYCYDTRRHNPVWVAYPLAACYAEGGWGRTTPDPWAPDPSLDARHQSKIYRSDGPSGSDPYQYWSIRTLAALGRNGTWSKGHLCMSSERGGAGAEINRQTFYPTNIAPQPTAAACDFGRVWGCVESLLSGTRTTDDDIAANDGTTNLNRQVDTLYVVAGCYYAHDDWQDYDSSNFDQPVEDPNRKLCIMPTHQWKIALRVKSPATHKPIAECSADELQAVGFWMESFVESSLTGTKEQLRAIAVPVSFVEQKMGMSLFPDVPASVKASFDPAEWGF